MKPFFVYILRCNDGSYYTGHTDDIGARMGQHHDGEIGYTSTRKPLELIWQGEFETREGALAFELQVKGWSRAKKEALIRADWNKIKELAKSKNISVRPELACPKVDRVSDLRTGLRRAQPERERISVRAEPVEALRQAQQTSGATIAASPIASIPSEVGPSPSSGQAGSAQTGGVSQKTDELLKAILSSDQHIQRRAIAKSITLLESTRVDHRAQGDELLTALLPHSGKSFRIGISGVPGVGKSTFIEVLGLYLIGLGHRVAVLTIDPSSTVSGGSILGDKTRMEKLSVHERAYIRPSPSSGTLGGVAEKTREAMLVCEAAGYDVVIVETVGVGQSETAVANMTDMFVLMQLPNAGDDLQAIKKGVMELADVVIINKADLDVDAAARAGAQISSAMRLLGFAGTTGEIGTDDELKARWQPRVMQLSALHNQSVDAFWAAAIAFKQLQSDSGHFAARRRQQALSWMWERIEAGLKQAFRQDPAVMALLPGLQADVESGRVPASTAARNLLLAKQARAQVAIK